MAYTLIRGKFHIHYPDSPRSGPQPDGDTIKFEPEQASLVHTLRQRGTGPDFNNRGYVNIRFEAIDALETHFQGTHQPPGLANAARDAMLNAAGYREVEFHPNAPTVARAEPLSPPGYILSRTLDQHGRIVGFVFAGEPQENDGSQICLHSQRVLQSINARLLASGQVYPSFYDTLPRELREALTPVTVKARNDELGLWPQNQGTVANPAVIRNLDDVKAAVIFPKLFRRLVSYFTGGATSLTDFIEWLRAVPGERDDNIVLPPMEFGHFHDIIRVEGDRLWLTVDSESFVIIDTPETWRSSMEQAGCGDPRPDPAAGDLRLVAALPKPISPEAGNETVTLMNTRNEAIDLAGYRLQDDDGGAGMLLHGVLAGGECVRIKLNTSLRLGNQGDKIKLVSPGNTVIDEVNYTSSQVATGKSIVFGRP